MMSTCIPTTAIHIDLLQTRDACIAGTVSANATTVPQTRQWCRRRNSEKWVLQLVHVLTLLSGTHVRSAADRDHSCLNTHTQIQRVTQDSTQYIWKHSKVNISTNPTRKGEPKTCNTNTHKHKRTHTYTYTHSNQHNMTTPKGMHMK